jgi:hypothetical protein
MGSAGNAQFRMNSSNDTSPLVASVPVPTIDHDILPLYRGSRNRLIGRPSRNSARPRWTLVSRVCRIRN